MSSMATLARDVFRAVSSRCLVHLGVEGVLRNRVAVARHAIDRFDLLFMRDVLVIEACMTRHARELPVSGFVENALVHKERHLLTHLLHGQRFIGVAGKAVGARLSL